MHSRASLSSPPRLHLLAGSLLLAFAAGCSSAASNADYPAAIQEAVDNGVTVVKNFPAASGLTGWVLEQDGRHSVVYTTADAKTLVAGVLIDEKGENLSSKYEEEHIPKPDYSGLYQQLEKTAYVTEGALDNPKQIIYAFTDANCPYCHYTWQALQPYEKIGLQVRWIPVAVIRPTSMAKAIAILSAEDKTAAFQQMEANHGKEWTPSKEVTEAAQPEIAAQVRQNAVLMQQFGIAGTPGLVWKDAKGDVQIKGGMPRLSEIPTITGLPEQKNTHPALEKFR